MADYRIMYTTLFNKITDAITLLQSAQVETEELYLDQEEADVYLLNQDNEKEGE